MPVQSAGIIPLRPDDTPARPLPTFPEEGRDEVTNRLWNLQVGFDGRLHEERGLYYPQDAPDEALRDDVRLRWVWGEAFAILQELDELREALEAHNGDEETVDILHFTQSCGNKLGLEPTDLGRFEDVFAQAAAECRAQGCQGFAEAFHRNLPLMVQAVNDLVGNSFKWWKNHASPVDWAPFQDGLRAVHYRNLVIASSVFGSAQAMHDFYVQKVQENHARQEGTVAGREDYLASR